MANATRQASSMDLSLLAQYAFSSIISWKKRQKDRPVVDLALRGKIILKWILKSVWDFSCLRIVSCTRQLEKICVLKDVRMLRVCPDLSTSLQPEDASKGSREHGEGTVEQGTGLRLFHLNLTLKTRFLFQATYLFVLGLFRFERKTRPDALGRARLVAIASRRFCFRIRIFNLQIRLDRTNACQLFIRIFQS